MASEIKVNGNDAVDGGIVTICYNKLARVSPLHLDFVRKDGHTACISLDHHAVRQLLKLIVDNI